ALYHPWLVPSARNAADEFDPLPPDGPACGVIARRSAERGAWIAPANEALQSVLAIRPPIAGRRREALVDANVNVLWPGAHGISALAADTLSLDDDLRPINVRRLLSLLRRRALQVGVRYVFEPNDDSFRRLVERGF